MLNWTLALNEELRGTGVQALALCPGPTATSFFREAGIPDGAVSPALMMSADEVITRGMLALGRGRSLVVTGWKNRLQTLASSLAPRTWVARIAAKVLARYRLGKVRS